jgi:hypothetical protein
MKKVIILLVAVCIIATMAFVGVGCKTAVDETQSTWQLSGQPDKAKYDEYFTEFYLGKLPLGQQMPLGSPGSPGMPIKTAVFIASEDQFCPVGTLKKGIPSGSDCYIAVYDTVAKKDFVSKAIIPNINSAGGFGWNEDPIGFPKGKYEYKLYIDDALVAVVPFEVKVITKTP